MHESNQPSTLHWTDQQGSHAGLWRSQADAPAPKRVLPVDDSLTADSAYRLASEGKALLWQGDYHNARQLLQAMARRIDRSRARKRRKPQAATITEAFHQYRQAQAQRARTLGMLLIELDADYGIALRRAPDVRQACLEAYGPAQVASVVSLRELQGVIGAHQWRHKGIKIAQLDGRIHPHYGVFAPTRSEYLQLIADAPLPAETSLAFDIGTGTGVLAALLAKRGVARIVATDLDPRATACAQENIGRLGLSEQVELLQTDLFPAGRANLIVCNPPWIPARASSPLERAVYDPDSRMLHGFLQGLAAHLQPGGEGWLILSDLAEHLGLRQRADLLTAFEAAGLQVIRRLDTRPQHPRAADASDPLHAARAAEITSLWCLGRL